MASYDPNDRGAGFGDEFDVPAEGKAGGSRSSGPGCLVWGCLIALLLAVLGVAVVVVGALYVRGLAIDFLERNSEPDPAELPEVRLTEAERDAVVDRWQAFEDASDRGEAAEVALTGDEVNVVLQHEEADLRDRVYVRVEDGRIVAEFSVPIESVGQFLGSEKLKGRYVNGEGEFVAEVRDGRLDLELESATIKGEPVEGKALEQLRRIFDQVEADPQGAANAEVDFDQIESLTVEDGIITLRSRERPGADTPEEPAPNGEGPAPNGEEPAPNGEEPAPNGEEPAPNEGVGPDEDAEPVSLPEAPFAEPAAEAPGR